MPKGNKSKSQLSITVDTHLVEKLRKKLSRKMIKTSTYIEYLIAKDLKNEKN